MVGFVANLRLFQIIGQCQIRLKTLLNNSSASLGRSRLIPWISFAQAEARKVLDGLPEPLRADGGSVNGWSESAEAAFGIQQANIHVTALCVEFALVRRGGIHGCSTHVSSNSKRS